MTMGQLLRARSTEARAERRAAILAAALRTLEQYGHAGATMDLVARTAKLAKGTLFLYFPTREALFLELLERLMEDWLVALHDAIARDERRWNSAGLAGTMTDTLAARGPLAALLPLSAALEAGVTRERLAEYRRRLLRRMFATGSLVEQRLGLARAADGVLALRYGCAIAQGLDWVDEPAELRTALTVLLNGFHRKT